jgi:diguanylate cyclase (GGDEF)-like protein
LVEAYALALGKRLGLPVPELRMLQAAAILSGIGGLAVPRYFSSASGRKQSGGFEADPVTGSDILNSAGYPAAVVTAVRSRHEHWDGSGYPDGLAAGSIPLFARILAIAERLADLSAEPGGVCLPSSALERLLAGSGIEFDPELTRVAAADYAALEQASRAAGSVPACEFAAAISSARDQTRNLSRLLEELGNSLDVSETMFTLDRGLSQIVAFDAIVVYLLRDGRLVPVYARGENAQLFSSVDLEHGAGAIAWSARKRAPLLNGDPSAEPGYAHNPARTRPLRSVAAAPLEDGGEMVGALALYRSEPDAFESPALGALLAVRDKAWRAIQNALAHQNALRAAAEDTLTGLANSRALFLRLDAELARSRRASTPLGVLVCELKGLDLVENKRGREAARQVVRAMASGLRGMCREEDCVARTGEQFVLVLAGFSPAGLAEKRGLIRALLNELSEKEFGERLIEANIAAAFYPEDGSDAEGLLATAESRLHQTGNEPATPGRFGMRIAELGAVIESFGAGATASDLVPEAEVDRTP